MSDSFDLVTRPAPLNLGAPASFPLFTVQPGVPLLDALEQTALLLDCVHGLCTERALEGSDEGQALSWASVQGG